MGLVAPRNRDGLHYRIEDYALALTVAEAEIVELEQLLDAQVAECRRLRERLAYTERALAHRRQQSTVITFVQGEQHARKSSTE